MKKRRIVVTGLGVVSCIGIGKDNFWYNLIKGNSGISRVQSFDTSEYFNHCGGEIKDFIPERYINIRKIKLMGRPSLLAIAAARLALADANLKPLCINANKKGIFMGTTMGESQKLEEIDEVWTKEGMEHIDNRLIYQTLTNAITANIALDLKWEGINLVIGTACSAGNCAIGYAYDLLRLGKIDIAISGGVDAFSKMGFTGFSQLGAMAPRKCQPFDKNRKGMLLAEGASILILEPLDKALARQANIYAEIIGCGLSCDAFHMTEPSAEGIKECINNALNDSGVLANEVDYINAHGTGTIHNDRAECEAIRNVFKDRYKKIPVNSIKSILGHAMGAASAIEAVACCLTIKNGVIPPTINFKTPDPQCDIDCVPNVSRRQKVNIALNNSFAFGGNNASLVLKKL